jgi:hypothetical protein
LQGLNLAIGAPLPYEPLFFKVDSLLFRQFQRQALLARAGFGEKSHQTPIPPLGQTPRKCGQRPHGLP